MRAVTLIFAAAILTPAVASAQTDRAAAVAATLACRGLAETARLACLDAALVDLAEAFPESAGALAAPSGSATAPEPASPRRLADREAGGAPDTTAPASKAEAAAFGAEDLPRARTSDEGPRALRAEVVQTDRTASGKLIFTLDNGQVWRQIDADRGDPRPPSGDAPYAVTIRKKLFGSHRLSIEGERPAVTVRRVQ